MVEEYTENPDELGSEQEDASILISRTKADEFGPSRFGTTVRIQVPQKEKHHYYCVNFFVTIAISEQVSKQTCYSISRKL